MTAGVLVLNASYEALGVVSVERAVGMVVDGDVDVVDVTDLVLHSPSTAIRVPSILRLQRYVRIPATRRIAPTRRAIFARDGYRCQYCGGLPRTSTTSSRAAVAADTSGRTWSPRAVPATLPRAIGCRPRRGCTLDASLVRRPRVLVGCSPLGCVGPSGSRTFERPGETQLGISCLAAATMAVSLLAGKSGLTLTRALPGRAFAMVTTPRAVS